MPVALISTRTSPSFGPSRSSSTISSGFFASNATAARVFILNSYLQSPPPGHSDWSSFAHAGFFRLRVGLGFVFMLGRAHAADRVVGAGTQVDVDVVHVAGHIRVVAECRHHVLLRRIDVLASAGDDFEEGAIAHALERVRQR